VAPSDDLFNFNDRADPSEEDEEEREFNFTLSSGSSNDRADPNLSVSFR
jgi:hypothetical protein